MKENEVFSASIELVLFEELINPQMISGYHIVRAQSMSIVMESSEGQH